MSNFSDVVVLLASTFVFVACLVVLFHVILDLFRDLAMGGGYEALRCGRWDSSEPPFPSHQRGA